MHIAIKQTCGIDHHHTNTEFGHDRKIFIFGKQIKQFKIGDEYQQEQRDAAF